MLNIVFILFKWSMSIWLLFGLAGVVIEFIITRKEIESIMDILFTILYLCIILLFGIISFFSVLSSTSFEFRKFFAKLFKPVIDFFNKPRFNQKNKEN